MDRWTVKWMDKWLTGDVPQRLCQTLTFESPDMCYIFVLMKAISYHSKNFIWKSLHYPDWLSLSRNHCGHVHREIGSVLLWYLGTPSSSAKKRLEQQRSSDLPVSRASPVFSTSCFLISFWLYMFYTYFYIIAPVTHSNMGHFCRLLTLSTVCPLYSRALPSWGFIYMNFLTVSRTKNIFSKAEDKALISKSGSINPDPESKKSFTSQPSTQNTYKTMFTSLCAVHSNTFDSISFLNHRSELTNLILWTH